MSQATRNLAEEIIRIVQINRTTINGLTFGEITFRSHQGRLIEVTAAETLKLGAGAQLSLLSLKQGEAD